MFKASVFVCCLYFCALTPYLTFAMTAEQKQMIHSHFETIGKSCIADNVISGTDIEDLRNKRIPAGPNAPCFLACVMKQIGVMDSSGMLQKETALDLAKKIFNDPEELKNMEEYLHSCSPVNEASVSDAEKGCDRAMLAYKCMVENAYKFGIDV